MRWLLIILLLTLPAIARAESPAPGLADLFASLKAAPNTAAAEALEQRITEAWLAEATPAVRLLLESGTRALNAHAASEAAENFGAATTLQPDLAEAWSDRGLARFALRDFSGATSDLIRALTLDPQHFTALQTLSYVAQARGNWKGALSAWQKAMALSPETEGGASRLRMLREKVLGQST